MVAQAGEILQARARQPGNRAAGPRQARRIGEQELAAAGAARVRAVWIAEPAEAAVGAPVQAVWIEAGRAWEATASGVKAYPLLPAAEAVAHLAELPAGQAAVPPEIAAAAVRPATEAVVPAAEAVVPEVAAVDGGK
jgi:hypothetical protein